MVQLGGLLGKLLWSLLKSALDLMKNVLKRPAKGFYNTIKINTSSSRCIKIHKYIIELRMCPSMLASRPSDSAQRTTLTISEKEIKDVMKIIKCLEESGLLVRGISKTIEN